MTLRSFQFIKIIGTGCQGEIWLARKLDGRDRDHVYAVKVLMKSSDPITMKEIINERNVSLWNFLRMFWMTLWFYFFLDFAGNSQQVSVFCETWIFVWDDEQDVFGYELCLWRNFDIVRGNSECFYINSIQPLKRFFIVSTATMK